MSEHFFPRINRKTSGVLLFSPERDSNFHISNELHNTTLLITIVRRRFRLLAMVDRFFVIEDMYVMLRLKS